MLEYIFAFIVVIFLLANDKEFLRDGQERGFLGGIYDRDGTYNFWDTISESCGYSGNPLYWID